MVIRNTIARITPTGTVTGLPLPAGRSPWAITDGDLWITRACGFSRPDCDDAIPRATPNGT